MFYYTMRSDMVPISHFEQDNTLIGIDNVNSDTLS